MRSSESTPSLRRRPIRLGIVLVGDDHARACTGRRLLRLGLATPVPAAGAGGVLLDPYSSQLLSAADRGRAERGGVVALDCSWNRLSAERSRRFGPSPAATNRGHRRLPMLVATNPQHFGRVGELNTVEALAAALWVLGRADAAGRLLNGFAGGPAFSVVNRARLERYAAARTPEEVGLAERASFGGPAA